MWALSGGIAFCPCGRRLVPKRTTTGGKVYWYLACGSYWNSDKPSCRYTKCHRAFETEERVARFVVGLLENPEALRERIEEQAAGEQRRLREADGELRRWRTHLRGIEVEREKLVDRLLEERIRETEFDARAAKLDADREATEREIEGLRGGEERLRELEELPRRVEEFLRDLPYLADRQRPVSGSELITGAGELTQLTPATVRERTGEELEALQRRSEDERKQRLRWFYEVLGLRVVAHPDGTLELSWSFGERVLPSVTQFESPVLGEVFSPDPPVR